MLSRVDLEITRGWQRLHFKRPENPEGSVHVGGGGDQDKGTGQFQLLDGCGVLIGVPGLTFDHNPFLRNPQIEKELSHDFRF